MSITAERLRLWVEALRSGEFTQARETLRDSDGYCCLGVACEVYRRVTGDGRWVGADFAPADDEFSTVDAELPDAVRQWLGLADTDPRITPDGERAIGLNDEAGWDFAQIADAIERTYGLAAA